MQVPDLVATRRVFLTKGVAFVPSDMLSSVVAGLFRQHVIKSLVMTAGRRATSSDGQENSRLTPILTSLTTRCSTYARTVRMMVDVHGLAVNSER